MTLIEKDLLIEKADAFLKINQFLNLKSDLVFKAFFENESDLLISFLTCFLPLSSGSRIVKVKILNPEIYPESRKQGKSVASQAKGNDQLDRNFILDLKIEFERIFEGERIQEISNVEMQTTGSPRLLDRIVAYASRLLSKLLGKGDNFNKLTTVFSVLLSAKNLKVFKGIKDFYHVSRLRRDGSYEVFSNILIFVVIELAKFDKKLEDLYTEMDCWCYLIKHSNTLDINACKKLIEKGGPKMAEAIHQLLEISQDSKLQEFEEARAKYKFDQMSRETAAHQEGIEKGIEKGMEKGIEKGIEKGRQEEKQSIALNLLQVTHMDIQSISKATGLSTQKILEIQKNLN